MTEKSDTWIITTLRHVSETVSFPHPVTEDEAEIMYFEGWEVDVIDDYLYEPDRIISMKVCG